MTNDEFEGSKTLQIWLIVGISGLFGTLGAAWYVASWHWLPALVAAAFGTVIGCIAGVAIATWRVMKLDALRKRATQLH